MFGSGLHCAITFVCIRIKKANRIVRMRFGFEKQTYHYAKGFIIPEKQDIRCKQKNHGKRGDGVVPQFVLFV